MIKNKTITLKDVSEAAGVSLATASRAMSGKGYISEINKKNY
ncbi:hypothetical protein ES705_05210 [subsurface metagenome]